MGSCGAGGGLAPFQIESDAYRLLLKVVPVPVVIAELHSGVLLDANEKACRMFGHTVDAFRRMTIQDLQHESARSAFEGCAVPLTARGAAQLDRVQVQAANGRALWVSVAMSVERVRGNQVVMFTFTDLTAQVRSEEATRQTLFDLRDAQTRLAKSEAHYRAVLHSAQDAILVSDYDTAHFVEVNRGACQLFGYTREEFASITGRMLHPASVSDTVDIISKALVANGWADHDCVVMQRKDGTQFYASLKLSLLSGHGGERAYVTIVRDVSTIVANERKLARANEALRKTQAQLVQASKMAAMGNLSAGIAHELNQPLTVIGGFARRIQKRTDSRVEDVAEYLDIIVRESARMSDIIGNIRQFGRQDSLSMESVSLVQPMNLALQLVEAQCRDLGIKIEVELTDDDVTVRGDSRRLQQVWLNLLTNARDAVRALPEESRWVRLVVSRRGDRVLGRVEDGGPGVAPEVRSQLFDPFFTTKDPDKGMGLGLSIAFSLVSAHKGVLRYDEGHGSWHGFEMSLPGLQDVV